jgi:hypothetical protein
MGAVSAGFAIEAHGVAGLLAASPASAAERLASSGAGLAGRVPSVAR